MAEMDELDFFPAVDTASSLEIGEVTPDTSATTNEAMDLPTVHFSGVVTRPTISMVTTTNITQTTTTTTTTSIAARTSTMATLAIAMTTSTNTMATPTGTSASAVVTSASTMTTFASATSFTHIDDMRNSSNLKSVLMNMTKDKPANSVSMMKAIPRDNSLPPNVVLPKTIMISPMSNLNVAPKKVPSTSAVTMTLKLQSSNKPHRTTPQVGSGASESLVAHTYSIMKTTPSNSSQQEPNSARPRANLTLTGYPVVINGESGVFLADKMLKNQDIILKTAAATSSAEKGFPIPQPKADTLRRTVGISSEPSTPIEIGLHHKLVSPSCCNTTSRLPTNPNIYKYSLPSVAEGGSQTSQEDFYDFDSFREKYLPQSGKFSYNYTTIDEEESLMQFRIAGVTTKEQVNLWVKELENKNTTLYRVAKTFKLIKPGAYKIHLRCHMFQGKNADSSSLKGKDFGCRSMLDISVEPPTLSRSVPNRLLREIYRCRVRFRFEHNHSIEDSLKHMPVRKEIREKIMSYFEEGLGISDAYIRHYQELKQQHGPRYYEIMCNRGMCPDKAYFYNIWKAYCLQKHGKVMKPPKSSTPKVPWNKGLRGITSLKEFFPIMGEISGTDVTSKRKGEPGKKERIRRAALDGIDSTLMASIRQNPETYSKAVACFVEVWKSMDDKERLIWLQTKIENDISQRVTLVPADHVDESLQAAESILLEDFATEHNYSDIVVTHQPPSPPPSLSKRRRVDPSQLSSSRSVTEFTFEVTEEGVPFYRVTNAT